MHAVTRIALPMIGALLLFGANPTLADPSSCPVINGALSCGGGGGGGSTNDLGYQLGLAFRRMIEQMARPQQTPPGPSQNYVLNEKGNAAYEAGDFATAENYYREALQYAPNDDIIKSNLQGALRQEGNAAFRGFNYAAAVNYYQSALGYGEDGSVRDDLDLAQRMLDMQQHDAQQAAQMEATIKEMTERVTATTASIASGLDFVGPGETLKDGPNDQATHANTQTAALPPVEPPTVDARDVPSGLPKFVDDNIPHTPAGDRTRRGYQEIMDHDWNAAHAWFQDALNHDPNNAGLKRLVNMSQYMLDRQNHPEQTTDIKTEINALRADSQKVDPQFERDTVALAKSNLEIPRPLQSKSIDDQAKALIPVQAMTFAAGKPLSRSDVRDIAHRLRVSAMNEQALSARDEETMILFPGNEADDAQHQDLAGFFMTVAAQAEKCNCNPGLATRGGQLQLPAPTDVEFLFPNNQQPSSRPVTNPYDPQSIHN